MMLKNMDFAFFSFFANKYGFHLLGYVTTICYWLVALLVYILLCSYILLLLSVTSTLACE